MSPAPGHGAATAGLSARTATLAAAAMVAFAANSILTRQALAPSGSPEPLIDPASFSSIRVVSGALTLWALVLLQRGWTAGRASGRADWRLSLTLFIYVAGFSFAYVTLEAGMGALILFGCVQLTMLGAALFEGERFGALEWGGLALAAGGLLFLLSPGSTAPDPLGALLMAAAGVGWGLHSLLGRGATDPMAASAWNFALCAPMVLGLSLIFVASAEAAPFGVALAVASGAFASGCGYAIWYAALQGLTAGRAAAIQLSVPAIAAFGGAALLGESLTLRLVLASIATLGGVALVLTRRSRS